MALVAENVRVAVTGKVSKAPAGTTLPTTVSGALNAAFVDLGYISEAGVVQSMGNSTTKIKAWQNNDIVRTIQTEHSLTYKFTCIETNVATLAAFYGNAPASGKVEINGLQPAQFSWVIDVTDDDGIGVIDLIRIVIPRAQVTDRGDVSFLNGEAVGYEMTLEAYPDPNYAGALGAPAKAYEYLLAVGIS